MFSLPFTGYCRTTWTWGKQEKFFHDVKSMLTSDCLLVHYDPTKEVVLACNASPYGVSDRFEDD